jgi:hypothetical protein
MSIRFACKCGKHLRAGDTMAGRHTLCPKCGALVAIPTKEQAAAGAALPRARPPSPEPSATATQSPSAESDDAEEIGPVLVRVRRRNDKDPNQFRRSIWVPLDPDRGPPPEKLPKPVRKPSRHRYVWTLEKFWLQSLRHPFRAWRFLCVLGLAHAGLLAWTARLVPRLNGIGESPPIAETIAFGVTAFLLTAYTVGLLDCVLTSAGAGEYRVFRLPGPDLGVPGAVSCCLCFLAGPIVPAVICLIYWHQCGDPDWLDRSILVELAGAAFAYWLFEILAARESGGLVADPAAVFSIIYRTGPRALLAAVGPPVFVYWYALVVVGSMAYYHVDGLIALPRLFLATTTGLFAAIFLLRVIGVWCYRGRPTAAADAEPVVAEPLPPVSPRSED